MLEKLLILVTALEGLAIVDVPGLFDCANQVPEPVPLSDTDALPLL